MIGSGYLIRSISYNPHLIDGYIRLAWEYERWSKPAEAMAVIQKGLKANPDHKDLEDFRKKLVENYGKEAVTETSDSKVTNLIEEVA